MAYTFISCEIEARLAYMRTCLKKPKTKSQNNSNMFSPGLGSWKSEIKVDSELHPLRCQGEKACQAPGLLATPGIIRLLRSGLCFGFIWPFPLCVFSLLFQRCSNMHTIGFKAHPDTAALFHLDIFKLITAAEALSLDKVLGVRIWAYL